VQQAERLAGAVWGHLIGDAVGVPYEFKSADQITTVEFRGHGTHHQPPGTWSDDGALMLALLDSLLRERGPRDAVFDTTDQASRFLAWVDAGAYTPDGDGKFDIGGATSTALSRMRQGTTPEAAGGTGEKDNGNGSLMRILPLALVERDLSDADVVDHAHRSSAITHGHPIAQAACALYVLTARQLLAGHARGESISLAEGTLRQSYHQRPDIAMRLHALDTLEAWSGRSGRGYVVDSFWSAWDAFAGAKSYRDTIERAVRYGHDTDTTACIAGGLAGLRWGLEGIPLDWRGGMRGKATVEPLIDRLLGKGGAPKESSVPAAAPAGSRTSTSHPLRVDWVDMARIPGFAGWTGRLGMTFLIGKHDLGSAGRHWRDLELDAARLRDHWQADAYLLLVEDHELTAVGVPEIARVLAAHHVELLRYPIVDQAVPTDRDALRTLLDDARGRLARGESVVVACRGGLGRTGTVIACLLRDGGLDAPAAIALTRASRHGTIETVAQEAFVTAWEPPPPIAPGANDLPFARYTGGGRLLLGRPRQGDVTARHGYGPPVFEECGYSCVYCGLDMQHAYGGWLQISVDHVVPRNAVARGFPVEWIEDIANLVTCCRACNEFRNQFTVADRRPADSEAFFDLRDRVFAVRKANILARHAIEQASYEERVAYVFKEVGGSREA
jgi:ADP-ribosyl-[dinitrogen reductase] hydrolase